MPITVVVGGQYGSEGKGKVCAHLALSHRADIMVRCGGPNAGHTVDLGSEKYELKQVPAGFLNPSTRLLIAPGALVNPALLLQEMELCGVSDARLGIDRRAGIVEARDAESEAQCGLIGRLGSTGVGVGSATSRRALRDPSFKLASDIPGLRPFLTSVTDEVHEGITRGRSVVIEGTQGYGLSLFQTEEWPFCTSRDTTAHSFLSEVGVGARNCDVIMAIRTYPIRVGGNSGPLKNELTWNDVRQRSGYPHDVTEYTTTTKRLRRVAAFDLDLVERAVRANAPTGLALHGADYLSYQNKGISDYTKLTLEVQELVDQLEQRTGVPVVLIGTGPEQSEIVDLIRPAVEHAADNRRYLREAAVNL